MSQNPPAFPVVHPGHTYGDGSSDAAYIESEGMTLRDYLAAQALPEIINTFNIQLEGWEFDAAASAYAVADAMLEHRQANEP